MSTVEVKQPAIITFEFRQDKGDEDYGTCMWARFHLDTENYTMFIESDCGNYGYGWCPTPETEKFLKLCARLNEGYLLEKLSDRTVVDGEETWKNIQSLIHECTEYEDIKNDWDMDEIKHACFCGYGERDVHDSIEEAFRYTNLSDKIEDYDIWESIEKDYPCNAKKIVQVYMEHIVPAIKKEMGVEL